MYGGSAPSDVIGARPAVKLSKFDYDDIVNEAREVGNLAKAVNVDNLYNQILADHKKFEDGKFEKAQKALSSNMQGF